MRAREKQRRVRKRNGLRQTKPWRGSKHVQYCSPCTCCCSNTNKRQMHTTTSKSRKIMKLVKTNITHSGIGSLVGIPTKHKKTMEKTENRIVKGGHTELNDTHPQDLPIHHRCRFHRCRPTAHRCRSTTIAGAARQRLARLRGRRHPDRRSTCGARSCTSSFTDKNVS